MYHFQPSSLPVFQSSSHSYSHFQLWRRKLLSFPTLASRPSRCNSPLLFLLPFRFSWFRGEMQLTIASPQPGLRQAQMLFGRGGRRLVRRRISSLGRSASPEPGLTENRVMVVGRRGRLGILLGGLLRRLRKISRRYDPQYDAVVLLTHHACAPDQSTSRR